MYELFDGDEFLDANPYRDSLLKGEALWDGLDQWLPGVSDL